MFRAGVGLDVNVDVHVALMMLHWWCFVDDGTFLIYLVGNALCEIWCSHAEALKSVTFEWFDWSKRYGKGCGAEQTCEETIHRSWLPWATCSMARSSFWKGKKRACTPRSPVTKNWSQRPVKPPGASQRRSQLVMGAIASHLKLLVGPPLPQTAIIAQPNGDILRDSRPLRKRCPVDAQQDASASSSSGWGAAGFRSGISPATPTVGEKTKVNEDLM